MIRHTDLNYQHGLLRNELVKAFEESLSDNSFIGGDAVSRFESDFARFSKAEHVVGVGNGTDALELILSASNLAPRSKVIVPANTFVATVEAVLNANLRPVFSDVDETFNLSPESVASLIDEETSAIIFVNLYGSTENIVNVRDIAIENNLTLIEDCAQAHGAESPLGPAGTVGSAGAFSFFPGKNLGGLGDAGAVVSSQLEIIRDVRALANHGRVSREDHTRVGRNSRLDALQARFLSLKLRYIQSWTSQRIRNAEVYLQELRGVPGLVLPTSREGVNVYHQFVVRTKEREKLRSRLQRENVETRIIYPRVIPDYSAYTALAEGHWQNAREYSHEILSLPVGEHLTELEILKVAQIIKSELS